MKKRVKQIVAMAMAAVMLTGCGPDSGKEVKKEAEKEENAEIAKKAKEERTKLKTDFNVSYDGIKTGEISAGVSVHDPSILQVDDTYYIYGSHLSAVKSTDLREWSYLRDSNFMTSTGYTMDNPTYKKILGSKDGALRFTGGEDSIIEPDRSAPDRIRIWAPDVDGIWFLVRWNFPAGD